MRVVTALYCLKRGYCNIILWLQVLYLLAWTKLECPDVMCGSSDFAELPQHQHYLKYLHSFDQLWCFSVSRQHTRHVLDPTCGFHCDIGLCFHQLVPLISSSDPTEYLGHLLPPPLCRAGWGAGFHLEQGSRAYRGASGAAHLYRAEGWPHWNLRQDHPLTAHQWGMR